MGESDVVYISCGEAARRLGCSPNTIGRAARRGRIGVFVEGGRLAALPLQDLPRLKPLIHETSGNPVWIATRGKKLRAKKTG